MQLPAIISSTLGLAKPWHVTKVVFASDRRRLDITIEYEDSADLACPHCGKPGALGETETCTWFHDDFFSYETYLHTRLPRPSCCLGHSKIEPPWSKKGSRFTVLQ
jgi:transposase